MRSALISIKSLLIKWAVAYLAGALLLSAFLLSTIVKADGGGAYTSSKLNSSGEKPRNKAVWGAFFNITEAPRGKTPKKAASVKLPKQKRTKSPRVQKASANISGNTYARGNCTWYAKKKRPDLPNSLGNANTWASRARAQGIPTGNVPKVGAIGQKGRHVVFIEKVNADGTVSFSEMNFKGYGIISHRTLDAGAFRYIY